MGGRGAGSGKGINGADVSIRGQTTSYYFKKSVGQYFYQRGLGGIPEPTPNNMSPRTMFQRMQEHGADVRVIPAKEIVSRQEAYQKEREETNRELDQAYANDKHFVKGSRANRTGNRASRHGR